MLKNQVTGSSSQGSPPHTHLQQLNTRKQNQTLILTHYMKKNYEELIIFPSNK